MFAPAMWAGMVYLSDRVACSNQKKSFRSFWMAISATIAGFFGSIVIYQLGKWITSTSSQQDLTSLSISTDYIGLDKATTIVSTQALLWQRLFPSSTNELGILLSLFLVSGPLIVFLIYLYKKGFWKLNYLAKLAIGACLILFVLAGIIISVKIGGGNNLHNLDMFLIALVFCAALAWRQRADLSILKLDEAPVWVQWNWVIFIFILAFFTVYQIRPLDVVPDYFVKEVLQRINREVDLAEGEGDVLFIDHRQLLSFGYVKDIPLIDEYEKKYLMEQTFKKNENYFKNFREDIRNQRFSLIITEPLFKKLGDEKEDSGFLRRERCLGSECE